MLGERGACVGVPSRQDNHRLANNPFSAPTPRPRPANLSSYLVISNSDRSVQSSRNPPREKQTPHKARRQLPLIVSLAPAVISQTFVRLNGLKRHTPAHLRAPVRARRTFQVRFPFSLFRGIIKSNAIPRDRRSCAAGTDFAADPFRGRRKGGRVFANIDVWSEICELELMLD